jgi:hypothetical protein
MSLEEKAKALEQEIANLDKDVSSKEKCVSILILIAIAVPLVVWLFLYWLKPWFVIREENKGRVINKGKMLMWIVLISAVLWVGLYIFYCSTGSSWFNLCYNPS